MAIIVDQNSNRTKLQEKLAAELIEKQKRKAKLDDQKAHDGVDDSAYIEDTKQTTSLAWVWIVLFVIVVVVAVWLAFVGLNS